jgi:hypothetical protein
MKKILTLITFLALANDTFAQAQSQKKISELPAATVFSSTDVVPVVQSGTTKALPLSLLQADAQAKANAAQAAAIAASQPAAANLSTWATKTPYAGNATIANGKTLNATNTLTLAGTDGSTLNIGSGGTLGSAAFTAASAYEVPLTFSTGLTRAGNTITATGAVTAVTAVTASLPLASSGGTTPAISISPATTSAAGTLSAADKLKIDALGTAAYLNSADFSTPKALSGLVLWADPSRLTLTDGSAVTTFVDTSGNGNSFSQATTANKPILKTAGINGLPSINFDGTNDFMESPSFLDSSFGSAFTFATVIQPINTGNGRFFAFSSAYEFAPFVGGNYCTILYRSNAANAQSSTADVTSPTVVITTYDGINARIFLNGKIGAEIPSAVPLALTGSMRIGARDSLGDTFNGLMGDVLIYKNALSSSDVQKLNAFLSAKYNLKKRTIVFDGDSRTAGLVNSSNMNLARQTLALLGGASQWYAANCAVSGNFATTLLTRGPSWVDPSLSLNGESIYVIYVGINDLISLASPAFINSTIAARCSAARAVSAKVVVCTIPPAGSNSTVESNRILVNASIRANWTSYADALADLASDPFVGQPGSQNDTTYFNPDGLHENDTGTGIEARIIAEAVNRATTRSPFPVPIIGLRDAVSILVDSASGHKFSVTLGGNRTLTNPINGYDGQRIIFALKQDATGSRTITLGSAYSAGPFAVTLSTAANATDYLECVYSLTSAKWNVVNFQKGF